MPMPPAAAAGEGYRHLPFDNTLKACGQFNCMSHKLRKCVAGGLAVATTAILWSAVFSSQRDTSANGRHNVKNYSNRTRQYYSHSPPLQSVFQRRLNDDDNSRSNLDGEPYDHPNYYAYLIVHYHKTGHHLSHQLRDLLLQASSSSSSFPFISPIHFSSNEQEHAFKSRYHEMETGCPTHMYLPPGILSVQAAPDFFCEPEIFAEYLLRNAKVVAVAASTDAVSNSTNSADIVSTDGTTNAIITPDAQSQAQQQQQQQQQYSPPHEKRGIKIIHLVRNPYTLAISNWIYHTQYPTPESWVKSIDPCAPEFWHGQQTLATMVSSTLLSGLHPVMKYADFDALHSTCTALFRTTAATQEWSYYTHLRHLPPRDALSLATAHMMIQGISGGDILRMANNIIKLKRVQELEERVRLSRHDLSSSSAQQSSTTLTAPRMIQVLTLSMDEFMSQPRDTTLRFLDFALLDTVPRKVKEDLATQYEQLYNEKLNDAGDVHITANKVVTNGQDMDLVLQREGWIDFLRRHELFGRILGNIELLVNGALKEGGR